MPETKVNSWFKKIGNFMLIFSFASVLWGGIAYMMEPRIEDFIMDVVNKNKGTSTRSDLAEEMGIKKKDVCEELGEMYKDSKHRHDAQDSILTQWIPYLIDETKWISVGFFVKADDAEVVKFHHWNGRDYDAWDDDQGWFYVKNGFKYYP
jgi:hypothetical protein